MLFTSPRDWCIIYRPEIVLLMPLLKIKHGVINKLILSSTHTLESLKVTAYLRLEKLRTYLKFQKHLSVKSDYVSN